MRLFPRKRRPLSEIGNWLALNGEAIYETKPWKVFGEGPTEIMEEAFTDGSRPAFTAKDVRFTCKGDTLYTIKKCPPNSGRSHFSVRKTPFSGNKITRP